MIVPPIESRPWYTFEEACAQLGLKATSGQNLIALDRFPVPHTKLGRRRIVMKDVLDEYFNMIRQAGLEALRERQEKDKPRRVRAVGK